MDFPKNIFLPIKNTYVV